MTFGKVGTIVLSVTALGMAVWMGMRGNTPLSILLLLSLLSFWSRK